MFLRLLMTVAGTLALASPAWPCTLLGPSLPAEELVTQAEVIVRARAERTSPVPGRVVDTMAPGLTRIEFRIISVLKGSLTTDRITFNGWFVPRDEPNPGVVPYSSARRSADASCFALGYRSGGEYLLFLKRSAHEEAFTPYWAPLAPINEQLFGPDDPWEVWVRRALIG